MLSKPWFIIRYWLCWICFFELARLIFLLYNFSKASASAGDSLASLFYGARMDMSMAAYLTLPVALLMFISIVIPAAAEPIILKIYHAIILLALLLLLLADLNLFNAWGYRIDASFLKYLASPKEMWASISYLPIFWILVGFVLLYALVLTCFNRLVFRWQRQLRSGYKWQSALLLILLMGLFIIPIRGGFQLAPLNQSSVYFSQNNFANMAAINGAWNFMHSLSHRSDATVNPFIYLDDKQAGDIVTELHSASGNSDTLKGKPNVILIVWESFTDKATHLTIEGKEITPGFNKLKKEGIYFSDIYATGDRTDKGIVGVLSGYPSQPTTSIVKIPSKAAKLPMMSRVFKNAGYHTAFYYGGELEFANMKAYLLGGSFDHFVSINDFQSKDLSSKWGAFDDIVMHRFSTDLRQQQQPFFATWLTLSSHEPYETPLKSILGKTDDASLFLNSLHYTDSTVYDFIQESKAQSWWKNTIVVIVADHGHRLPVAAEKRDDFHIPLLIIGGGLEGMTKEITKTGSQTDLAATVLGLLNMPAKEFVWSKNLLDSSVKPWAYFSFNNGFGMVEGKASILFDNVGKRIIAGQPGSIPGILERAKALQQKTFQDYLSK